jgi:mRNA-degrading endonuclease RelE of RelBE toxin-antitoxin system
MEETRNKLEGSVQEEVAGAPGKSTRSSRPTHRTWNAYKIKLRSAGYRMVYRVMDEVLVVTVIAVGKRERGDVYKNAVDR